MNSKIDLQPLIEHLCQHSALDPNQAGKLVDEVIAFLNESPEEYIRRRHTEIKRDTGLTNPQIFARIESEVTNRVFSAPALSQRQIRRIIYG